MEELKPHPRGQPGDPAAEMVGVPPNMEPPLPRAVDPRGVGCRKGTRAPRLGKKGSGFMVPGAPPKAALGLFFFLNFYLI